MSYLKVGGSSSSCDNSRKASADVDDAKSDTGQNVSSSSTAMMEPPAIQRPRARSLGDILKVKSGDPSSIDMKLARRPSQAPTSPPRLFLPSALRTRVQNNRKRETSPTADEGTPASATTTEGASGSFELTPSPEVDELSDEPVLLPAVSEEENHFAIPIQVFRTDLDMQDGSSEEDDEEWRKEAVCSPRGGNTPVACVPPLPPGAAPTDASLREATRRLSREITPDDPAKAMPKFCGSPILVASLRSCAMRAGSRCASPLNGPVGDELNIPEFQLDGLDDDFGEATAV